MVQALGYHRVMERRDPAVLKGSEQECYRMFWVVYMIERQVCFLNGRSPVRSYCENIDLCSQDLITEFTDASRL
jgi:hypothetical protein